MVGRGLTLASAVLLVALETTTFAAPCLTPTPRRAGAVAAFKRLSGYPKGRPGYVVDHIVPLCACGDDAPYNMQWQPYKESLVKDRFEREMCASLRRVEAGVIRE